MPPSTRTDTRFFPMYPGQPRSATVRTCASCDAQQSAAWRVGDNGERLCNKCGLRRKRLKMSRETSRRRQLPELRENQGSVYKTIGGRYSEGINLLHENDSNEGSPPESMLVDGRNTWTLPVEPLPRLSEVFPHSNHENELSARKVLPLLESQRSTSAVMFIVVHGGMKALAQQCGTSKSTLNNTKPAFVGSGKIYRRLTVTFVDSMSYCGSNITAPVSGLCSIFDSTAFEDLRLSVESPLRTFFWNCASVHQDAICRQSSIYAATETFICEHAGESVVLTAFALLREKYDSRPSPAAQRPSGHGFRAAQDDLVFGFAITGQASDMQPLRNFLHFQSLCTHIRSERTKRALWDLSRLPTGSHIRDSETYVWYQRILVEPGPGINMAPGPDQEQFRRIHQVMFMKSYCHPSPCTPEHLSVVAHELRKACITTCQEWFIAVLDESSKFPDEKQQLSFIEANRKCMLSSIEGFVHGLVKMNVNRPMHICSFDCEAHIQPSFHSVLDIARHTIDELFCPESLPPYVRGTLAYPTQDQIRLSRIIGLTQFYLYFSDMVLAEDTRLQLLELTRPALVNARLELAKAGGTMLVWNYLPIETAKRALSKLRLAQEKLKHHSFICI